MIDYAKITVKAGNGGPGAVSFVKRRAKLFGPPDGGDGGKGGDVYIEVSKNLSTLAEYNYNKRHEAEDGRPGGTNQKSGEAGKDLRLFVPNGTLIKDVETSELIIDMANTTDPVLIAKGGLGGRGNMHMRKYAAHAKGPVEWERWQHAQPGQIGEERELLLELKLIADIGLVGLPNAGKSTLISVITAAKPKIADYPFTTLEPNLGVMKAYDHTLVVADIPGLIEGASEGKGLGKAFLRHIERTKILVHLTQSIKDYAMIRTELGKSSKLLLDKPEIVVISKADTLTDEQITTVSHEFMKRGITPIVLSAVTHSGIEALQKAIIDLLE